MPSQAAERNKKHHAIDRRNCAIHLAKEATPEVNFDEVAKIATREVHKLEAKSQLLSTDKVEHIPKFALNELLLGKVLGKGGFGTVTEILAIDCRWDVVDTSTTAKFQLSLGFDREVDKDDLEEQMKEDKEFIAAHCIRDSGDYKGDARYCIKALSPEIINSQQVYQGVIDMVVETMVLAVLSHPHIIPMRATSSNSMFKPDSFILLDRLYDTLEVRIPKWKLVAKKAQPNIFRTNKKSSRFKLDKLMETKLRYACDLVGAFEYMHGKNLIYRDLKPENVGFNIRDDIVLFDFGLARETYDDMRVTDHTWNLTGCTGTLRYMAPEVATDKPYGHSADMYSFAVLLWEMLKGDKAFPGYSKKMHSELVVNLGGRPTIDDSWGPMLKGFIHSCWHQDLEMRPTAEKASAILKRELSKIVGGNGMNLNNFKRNSTDVNRNALRERKVK